MNQLIRAAMTAAAAMLAYHLVTASVARGVGMAYEQAIWLEVGIWFIYFAAGFIAAWRFRRMWAGIIVALGAAVADGVVGWRVTAAVYQPMRIIFDNPVAEFEFALEMLVLSAILGGAGAVAGRAARRLLDRVGTPATSRSIRTESR